MARVIVGRVVFAGWAEVDYRAYFLWWRFRRGRSFRVTGGFETLPYGGVVEAFGVVFGRGFVGVGGALETLLCSFRAVPAMSVSADGFGVLAYVGVLRNPGFSRGWRV